MAFCFSCNFNNVFNGGILRMQDYEKLIIELLKGETSKEKYNTLFSLLEALDKSLQYLTELQKAYLFDIDFEGNIKTDLNKLLKMWFEVDKFIKEWKK